MKLSVNISFSNLQFYSAGFNVLPPPSPGVPPFGESDPKAATAKFQPKATGKDICVQRATDPFERNAAPVGR